MNKGLLLALGSVMMFNVHAESWCGYKDYFHISNQSHPAISVMYGSSDSDIYLSFVGPRSFIIRDTSRCSSGYAHVTVGYDPTHWCVLDIKDGPFINHPQIHASCNGMKYVGTDYDGINSYSYTIKFD